MCKSSGWETLHLLYFIPGKVSVSACQTAVKGKGAGLVKEMAILFSHVDADFVRKLLSSCSLHSSLSLLTLLTSLCFAFSKLYLLYFDL